MTIFSEIKAQYSRLPTAIRAGWTTAWLAFIGLFLSTITGLLPGLAEAISTGNFDAFYQSLSVAHAAILSAARAFLAGVVNTVYRFLRPIGESYTEIAAKNSAN